MVKKFPFFKKALPLTFLFPTISKNPNAHNSSLLYVIKIQCQISHGTWLDHLSS